MTIESTDLQNSTNPAITYSECYAQPLFTVYIDFLDCKNKYIKTRKEFLTYDDAHRWMCDNFDKPNRDFINYY